MGLRKILIGMAMLPFMAMANPLNCREHGNKYVVNLSEDHHVALVLYDRNRVEFGDLQCRQGEDINESRTDLFCTSRNVADAGYTTHFVQMDGATFVHLSEINFFGVNYLTTLPCFPKRTR